MKKIFSTLLISLFGLVSFGYCLDLPNSIQAQNYSSISNEYPNDDSFICFQGSTISQYSFNEFAIRDNNYNDLFLVNGNGVKFNGGFYCTIVPSGTSRLNISRNEGTWSLSSVSFYQFLIGSDEPIAPPECDEAVCNLVIYDSFNMMSSNTQYGVEPGGIQDITFSYNSSNSSYSVGGSSSSPVYTFTPDTRLLNCSSNLTSCDRDLTTCQSSLNNAVCESHIQFEDISNGTGVKTLSSFFSPFSGANNNSIYYDSDENVVQIDSQYGVAEIISAVPSVPPEPCDCSDAISGAIASCNSQLSTLSGNYNSCLGELNSCMAGGYNTGDLQWSAIFINQIQHIGKPVIRINIPEEISRDYSNTGDSFDLDINGYNQDTEYIDSIITAQNYKPTKEDFTKLVGLFGNYGGLLLACLLVIIIFSLIRKIFK